jgi:hypothetical protein
MALAVGGPHVRVVATGRRLLLLLLLQGGVLLQAAQGPPQLLLYWLLVCWLLGLPLLLVVRRHLA